MYGLVARGIKQFVIEGHDEATWQEMCARAGVSAEDYDIRQNYDDADVYALVATAAEMLEVPAEEVLIAFGKYWPNFARTTRFGRLLTFGGQDFESLMRNLDHMHASIRQSLPGIRNPSFVVKNEADGALMIEYYSEREGLCPFVVGLLHGCAALFDQTITVEQVSPGNATGRFLVREVAAENRDAA